MKDGKKAAIVGAIGLGILGIYLITRPAKPAEKYACPYCGATFDTYEDLAAHVQTEHPGERIPLPIEWE